MSIRATQGEDGAFILSLVERFTAVALPAGRSPDELGGGIRAGPMPRRSHGSANARV